MERQVQVVVTLVGSADRGGGGLRVAFEDVAHVLFRHDEHVYRRLRVDVPEGKHVFILVHLVAGNLPGDDLAEDAVHNVHLPSITTSPRASVPSRAHMRTRQS